MNRSETTNQQNKKNLKRSLRFKNLTPKQKRLLEASALGVSGIAFGALAVSLMGFSEKQDNTEEAVEPNDIFEGTEELIVPIYPSAPFSEAVEEDMSFNEAFASAREDVGAGGFFEWNGQTYNTYYKEEWDSLSDEEQTDFSSSVDQFKATSEEDISSADEILQILNDLEESESIEIEDEDIVILDDDASEEDIVIIEDEPEDEDLDEMEEDDIDPELDEFDDGTSEVVH